MSCDITYNTVLLLSVRVSNPCYICVILTQKVSHKPQYCDNNVHCFPYYFVYSDFYTHIYFTWVQCFFELYAGFIIITCLSSSLVRADNWKTRGLVFEPHLRQIVSSI
uniref:Uncharacterized protein n=1 Tax=Cacopsylla melanoneura TaxID=428564 RepID=A0A8D8TMG2_9HEMI